MFSEKFIQRFIGSDSDGNNRLFKVEPYYRKVQLIIIDDYVNKYKGQIGRLNYCDYYDDFERYIYLLTLFNWRGISRWMEEDNIDLNLLCELRDLNDYNGEVFRSSVYEEVVDIISSVRVDRVSEYKGETYDEETGEYYMGDYENENYGCIYDDDELDDRYNDVKKVWMNDIEKFCRETITKQCDEYTKSLTV
jgi:hypothetical protein